MDNTPIQNPDRTDIIGKRKDGGVDLLIVASGPLTSDQEVQQLLLEKVETYLGYINSEEFKSKFGNLPPEKVLISISCDYEIDPVIVELVERMKPWATDNNCSIRIGAPTDGSEH